MNGIFMAKGPQIRARHTLNQANLIDLAPTILYSMGLPIPKDMDGQVLFDVFSHHFLAEYPPTYIEADADYDAEMERYTWSLDEEEALITRLQDLGYLA